MPMSWSRAVAVALDVFCTSPSSAISLGAFYKAGKPAAPITFEHREDVLRGLPTPHASVFPKLFQPAETLGNETNQAKVPQQGHEPWGSVNSGAIAWIGSPQGNVIDADKPQVHPVAVPDAYMLQYNRRSDLDDHATTTGPGRNDGSNGSGFHALVRIFQRKGGPSSRSRSLTPRRNGIVF